MYSSIFATDMLTVRGSHAFEGMDEAQLVDLGIERTGPLFLLEGVRVRNRRFNALALPKRVVKVLAAAGVAIVTIVCALPAMIVSSTQADTAVDWTLQPTSAFVEAYVYACQPVEYDNAGVREPLSQVADWVHGRLFLDQYNGSCRDFYFGEVVPRLDGELQPFFIPEQSLEEAYFGAQLAR
jgi:hypothetical protein